MAEVYTVVVNNQTPTEITGGRVGHFALGNLPCGLIFGGSALSITYPGGNPTESEGARMNTSLRQFSVTSPDEVYVLTPEYGGGSLVTYDLVIFHNR